MTKPEYAERLVKTLSIESCEQWLEFHPGGVRAAIPNTGNLIMVGPPEWIAKNVPGLGAMVEGATCDDAWAEFLSNRTDYPSPRDRGFFEAGYAALFAATTQASTAQAELPDGIKRDDIERAIGETEYKYFGDYEMGDDQRNAVEVLVKCAQSIIAATSSTDAQAAPTDLSKQLRDIAKNYGTGDFLQVRPQMLNAAAEEIERYYGGMMAWKRTAEAKDADDQAAAEVRDARELPSTDDVLDEIKRQQEGATFHFETPRGAVERTLAAIRNLRSAGDTGGVR